MDIYKKIGVTAGQFYTGCGFAILGVVAELFVRHLISVNKGTYMDTFGSIMGAWTGCFLGLLFGVSLYGYNFLKRNRRQNEFLKFLIISAFGISVGLYVPHFILTDLGGVYELHWLFQLFLMISIPITGISLGSILVLTKGQE